jgi:hypothetical protein
LAAAVLAFDGVALTFMGWWGGRPVLALVGIVFVIASGLVLLSWRWYRRRLDDLAVARRGLSEEAREIQRAIRGER